MRYFRVLLLPILLVSLTGCHTLASVSLTQIPPQRNKKISAEVSKFIVLGLSFDNDFVDGLSAKLADQCEGGKVSGILTKDEVINYFLMIFYRREVTATGYCLKKNNKVTFLEVQQ